MAGKVGMRDKLMQSPARAEAWRAGVRVGLIRNRLQKHFLGEIELSPTQLKAAEILLNRTVPTIASFEHTGEVTQRFVADLPEVSPSVEAWSKQLTHLNG